MLTVPEPKLSVAGLKYGGTGTVTVVEVVTVGVTITEYPCASKKRTDGGFAGSKPEPLSVSRCVGATDILVSGTANIGVAPKNVSNLPETALFVVSGILHTSVPLHPPLVQPAKLDPLAGVAVRVTMVPLI